MTKKIGVTVAAEGPMTMTAMARAAALLTMTTGLDNIVTEQDLAVFR